VDVFKPLDLVPNVAGQFPRIRYRPRVFCMQEGDI